MTEDIKNISTFSSSLSSSSSSSINKGVDGSTLIKRRRDSNTLNTSCHTPKYTSNTPSLPTSFSPISLTSSPSCLPSFHPIPPPLSSHLSVPLFLPSLLLSITHSSFSSSTVFPCSLASLFLKSSTYNSEIHLKANWIKMHKRINLHWKNMKSESSDLQCISFILFLLIQQLS